MKPALKLAALAVGICLSSSVNAECTLNTRHALICMSSVNAATAYRNYGFNEDLVSHHHSQEILRDANCGRTFRNVKEKMVLEEVPFKSGPVAFSDGVVDVVYFFSGKYAAYVARPYIEGTCKKWVNKPVKLKHSVETLSAG